MSQNTEWLTQKEIHRTTFWILKNYSKGQFKYVSYIESTTVPKFPELKAVWGLCPCS